MPKFNKDFSACEELLVGLRKLVGPYPDAQEYTMVHHPAFRVAKKPFVVVGLGKEKRVQLSVNLGHMEQAELLTDPRFIKTPYMGHNGWVTLGFEDTDWQEIEELLEASYRRVCGKRRNAKLDAVLGVQD